MKFYKTIVLFLCFLIISTSAHAYIDPVTGSLIIQGLIAAVVGALAMVKFQYVRLKSFLRKITGSNWSDEDKVTDNSDNDQNLNQEKQNS